MSAATTLSLVQPRNGAVSVRLHRMPDKLPPVPRPAAGHRLLDEELDALAEAFKPYARRVGELEANGKAQRKARLSDDPQVRGTLPELVVAGNVLQADVQRLRGTARVAVLDAIDAAALRAGLAYHAAARMLADTAAELEAFATLHDELLHRCDFDPLGVWAKSALLAPPLEFRPRGWTVAPDSFGRDCYWVAGSVSHTNAVRKAMDALRAEMTTAAKAAPWPFT